VFTKQERGKKFRSGRRHDERNDYNNNIIIMTVKTIIMMIVAVGIRFILFYFIFHYSCYIIITVAV
jgi:hypothetical protein